MQPAHPVSHPEQSDWFLIANGLTSLFEMRTITLLIIGSFVLVQLLAAFVGWQFISQSVSIVENPADLQNAPLLFAYVLFNALVLLLILKFYKGNLLFYAIELLLELLSATIFALLALPAVFALLFGGFIVVLRVLFPSTRTVLLLFSAAVVGALLGSSLDILPAIIFASILGGYDVIAVFYTKHMITLARELSQRNAGFSIKLTANRRRQPERRRNAARALVEATLHRTPREAGEPESIELGTGDLVIPAMLLVSSLKISAVHAAAAFVGSLAGLFLMLYLLEKRKGYWPALPPLVFGALFALLLVQLAAYLKF